MTQGPLVVGEPVTAARPVAPARSAEDGGVGAMVRRAFFRSRFYRRAVLDGPVPGELQRPFPLLTPGNTTQGQAVIENAYLLYGRRAAFGAMPWSVLPPGHHLQEALHRFAWLPDLQAIGSAEARGRARDLLTGWIANNKRWSALAWSPDILGERLSHWLSTAPFTLDGATGDERARFFESASRQARYLARASRRSRGTIGAFAAASGEVAGALCLGVVPLAPALRRLEGEIARQINPDGGHCSRSPALLLCAFGHLLTIRAALTEAAETVPDVVTNAIERMAPMLRAFRHGDGGLALFHGCKEEDRALIDSLLAASRVSTPAPISAPDTGYERLTAGRTVVLVDVGPPPPGGHRAPLALEIGNGRERIIVNCGAFGGDDRRWHNALVSTPAHSTITVEDTSVPASVSGWLGRRPLRVLSSRQEAEGSLWLDASHDGYRSRFGVVHRRRLYLSDTGREIRGEDLLEGRRGRTFALRFHLHPDLEVSLAEESRTVSITTHNAARWEFLAAGGTMTVEESTYLGTSDQPRRAQQIVITGKTLKGGAQVKWALRRTSN